MTQKETCKRTYDDGSPMSDEHWYYSTYFSCGNEMTEISTYRRPYLETTEFKYCPYCGKPLEDAD